ncbi:MAG: hypothetical protein QOG67_2655 [Verrucomicrobiota bacterium]
MSLGSRRLHSVKRHLGWDVERLTQVPLIGLTTLDEASFLFGRPLLPQPERNGGEISVGTEAPHSHHPAAKGAQPGFRVSQNKAVSDDGDTAANKTEGGPQWW